MGIALVALLGCCLVFYGLYGEPGVLYLGLEAPFIAGVAMRLAILTRLSKRAASSPTDLKMLHGLVLGACFYFFDFKHITEARWPEVYGVGMVSMYIAMGLFVYHYDVKKLNPKPTDSEGEGSVTEKT